MVADARTEFEADRDLADFIVTGATNIIDIKSVTEVHVALRKAIHAIGRKRAVGAAIRKIVIKRVLQTVVGKNDFCAPGVELAIFLAESKIRAEVDLAGPKVRHRF